MADKIAIAAFGSIKCIGSCQDLKHKFGVGYNLNLVALPGKTEAVIELVRSMVPQIVVISSNAGNIIIGVAENYFTNLCNFVEHLEQESEPNMVKEWSIAQATLEEVYLKVTKEGHFDFSTDAVQAKETELQEVVLPYVDEFLPQIQPPAKEAVEATNE